MCISWRAALTTGSLAFGDDDLTKTFNRGAGDDQFCYIFDSALGSRNPAAEPDAEAAQS